MMLEIKDITAGYSSRIVLQNVNLTVNSEDLWGIIGPNGSGKTTLLRVITNALKPGRGEVLLDGRDVKQIGSRELAKKVAVVSQDSPANSMMVVDFVLLGRIPYYKRFQFLDAPRDREIVHHALELTGTSHLKNRPMSDISGGERQLVLMARALAQEPDLLLLDEPTNHLDITHQVGCMDLIKDLNKDFGLTVMMVLHDLNLASEYCDKLALVNDGQIYRTGTPEEVLTYQAIEDVYNTTVVVEKNPVSSKPYCFLVSREEKERTKRQYSKNQ